MHYHSTQSPTRRLRPVRGTARRPVHDLHIGYDRASIIPYAREGAPRRESEATVWTRSIRAASACSHLVTEAVPNLLVAIVCLIFTEAMAGCAAYAEAMYGIPLEPAEPVPAEIFPKPRAGLMLVHTRDDTGRRDVRAHAGASARATTAVIARPHERRSVRHPLHVRFLAFISACRSRIRKAHEQRLAIAELRQFDDRSLRDIGLAAGDIEYVVRHGAGRE